MRQKLVYTAIALGLAIIAGIFISIQVDDPCLLYLGGGIYFYRVGFLRSG